VIGWFRYVNYDKFTGVSCFETGIHVCSTAEVTGYVLLLTDDPNKLECRRQGYLHECECANITNPVGVLGCDFHLLHLYRSAKNFKVQVKTGPLLTIKLLYLLFMDHYFSNMLPWLHIVIRALVKTGNFW